LSNAKVKKKEKGEPRQWAVTGVRRVQDQRLEGGKPTDDNRSFVRNLPAPISGRLQYPILTMPGRPASHFG
jgi:hypothetical protein